jgi:hypothetical protein
VACYRLGLIGNESGAAPMALQKPTQVDPKMKKKPSNKGKLVKGASKLLPLDLLYEATFRTGLQEILRGYSGLYFLYKKKKSFTTSDWQRTYTGDCSTTPRISTKGSGIVFQSTELVG